MITVRIPHVIPVVGALVLLAGTLHGPQGMAVHPPDAGMAASVADLHGVAGASSGTRDRVAQSGQAAAPARGAPARVLRVAGPRPGQGLHLTFPRTWRRVTLEVGTPAPRPAVRVPCETCRPGTVLEADL